jgi:hypothetical protein
MRKFFSLLVIAAAVALPVVVSAGESGCYRCTNQCPLAKQANEHRSMGEEAVRASETVRGDVAKTVSRNLEKI